jgi:triphosphoribosyl-dephospho-CoA synthetase
LSKVESVGPAASPAASESCLIAARYGRDTARAMSQENVEIVRAAFEAWNAGNMDAVRELHDPDVIVCIT